MGLCFQIFVKQRLDLLCAKAWLEESEQLRQQATALSVQEGMICAHTSMVTFQTTPQKHQQLKKEQASGKPPAAMRKTLALVSLSMRYIYLTFGEPICNYALNSYGCTQAANSVGTAFSLSDRCFYFVFP